jgi:hypothetical protein
MSLSTKNVDEPKYSESAASSRTIFYVPYEVIFYLIIICFKMNTMMCSVLRKLRKIVHMIIKNDLHVLNFLYIDISASTK